MLHGFCLAVGLFAVIESRKHYSKAFKNDFVTWILPIVLDFFGTFLMISSVVGYYIDK